MHSLHHVTGRVLKIENLVVAIHILELHKAIVLVLILGINSEHTANRSGCAYVEQPRGLEMERTHHLAMIRKLVDC